MRIFLTILLFLISFQSMATHVMGGEITWKCQNGNYVFELVFYRDCNGAEVNTVSETIQVWNHNSVTSIPVNFVTRINLSPVCTQVPGSPPQLSCGTGGNGGNGVGAFEKIIYRSTAISLPGTPPAEGWIFTAKNFSRSSSVTNLEDPTNYGITISAYMFAIPGQNGACIDNSPIMLQDPYLVSCAGIPYKFNMNPIDPDLDSLVISFGKPLNNFAGNFNPPTSPQELTFESGFSFSSPTPDQSFNAANIPTNVDPITGELTFTSNTVGNFNVKLIVKSYRNSVLIAQVEREILLVVMNCLPTNNAPVITGPFGGNFETTINAGQLVNFTLNASDVELLQDGTPQSNTLTASGPMFGTNFTSNTGCSIAPCATLNNTLPTTNTQGVSTVFNWQTTCAHLENQFGVIANSVPYHFVFKVTDNYCQVPKVSYATVTINVVNPGVIPANDLLCIQTEANGDLSFNWTPINNASNSLSNYSLNRINPAAEVFTSTNTTLQSTTITGTNSAEKYFMKVASGCEGNTIRTSDTISNIHLNLLNPSNGTAVLQWNQPRSTPLPSYNAYFYIYREYPANTWSLLDSVPYSTVTYTDTIDICQAFLNYKIELKNGNCRFTSNIKGDTFQDKITPSIPIIESVSIDTLSGNAIITWDVNSQKDTYGYIIYKTDDDGILYEVDTIYGHQNVTYTFATNGDKGPFTFSVAAFDSCFTATTPATFQTSAKSQLHTSIRVNSTYDICSKTAKLSWTPYLGWPLIETYQVFQKIGNGPWQTIGNTLQTNFNITINTTDVYSYFIKAIKNDSVYSFSSIHLVSAVQPTTPAFNYLKVATVHEEKVKIEHRIELVGGIKKLILQRKVNNGVFEDIEEVNALTESIFTDEDVDVNKYTYTYRIQVIDSCGNRGVTSNIGQTILVDIQTEDLSMVNTVSWNHYIQFDGTVIEYRLYRKIDELGTYELIATLPPTALSYEDNLYDKMQESGKVCYIVDAIESFNRFNDPKISRSNEACMSFEPLIFIPNAFTPEGLNPVFLPIVSLINPQDYQLSILNRWGEVIFHSTDLQQGWDGRTNTIAQLKAPIGLYMYVLQVKDGNGVEYIKRGHVNLIR